MVRSFVAVLVGFFTIVILFLTADSLLQIILPGSFDENGRVEAVPVLLFMVASGFFFGVLGSCIAALIARRKGMKHALIVGAVGLGFAILGAVTLWDTAPAWYHLLSLLLIAPAAWLGGWIGERYLAHNPQPTV